MFKTLSRVLCNLGYEKQTSDLGARLEEGALGRRPSQARDPMINGPALGLHFFFSSRHYLHSSLTFDVKGPKLRLGALASHCYMGSSLVRIRPSLGRDGHLLSPPTISIMHATTPKYAGEIDSTTCLSTYTPVSHLYSADVRRLFEFPRSLMPLGENLN